ncbi:DNA polymerase III subunit gamma/tau [Lentisalinibacter salinarum]|uniref:DNA polymerase III subunit gamma/tau n=1 Tax=Lentisalinibacter salinarum TaxID=2992239 RepID=UPI00386B742F
MSYLVLARKWRPRAFGDMVGQQHVLQALTNALASGRLHHAYLFAGTRGVGKTTIARILAKALNCEQGVGPDPCGECSACREIDEGRFVDLIEVDAASRTKVDDTRDLLDNVQYAPARGRYKVYLIDEVHMLSMHSFNALLKTLEEPPPHVKFLLATTDPQKLPVTVLSRCLQFNLKRLTPQMIGEHLTRICEAEQAEAEPEALALIARAAEGSVRDSLSLLDQAIAYGGGAVREDETRAMLGTVDRQHVTGLLDSLAAVDGSGLLATVAAIDEQFPDYARLLDEIAAALQRIAVYQLVGATDLEEADEAMVAAYAGRFTPDDVQLYYQVAITGRRDLPLAPDPRAGFEMTLLRMLAFRPAGAAGQASGGDRPAARARSLSPAKSVSGEPAAAAPTQDRKRGKPSAATAKRPAGKTPEQGPRHAGFWSEPDWHRLAGQLEISGSVRLLAANCAFLAREGNGVQLQLDERSETLLTEPRRRTLERAMAEYFGEPLKVSIRVGGAEETPVQREQRLEAERLEAAKKGLEEDPNVRILQDMFGAELQPDTVRLKDQD